MQVPDLRQPYPPSRPTLRTHRYIVMGLIYHAYRAVHDPVQVKSKEDRNISNCGRGRRMSERYDGAPLHARAKPTFNPTFRHRGRHNMLQACCIHILGQHILTLFAYLH